MTEPTRGPDESSDPSARVDAHDGERSPIPDPLVERVVDRRVLHKGRYLDFRVETVERADGSRATRDIVGHPGAVAVLALDPEDRVLLVRQYRVPAGSVLLEIPAGTLDVDEATGAVEDPDEAARRELEEETGYRAGSWRKLASFWTAPGFATELMHLYLATDLTPAHDDRLGPDEDERLELDALPLADAIERVLDGRISDAKSIVGLLMLERLRLGAGAGVGAAAVGDGAAGSGASVEPGAGRVIHVRFFLTMSDAIRSNIALARSSRATLVFGLVLVALAIPPLLAGGVLAAIPPFAFGLAMISGVFIAPFVWFQTRRRPEVFSEPWDLEIDERGMRYTSALGVGVYSWTSFRRLREDSGFFYLDAGRGSTLVIPVAPLEGEAYRTFLRLAGEAGLVPDGRRVDRAA